jgi:hypothetical protein
MKNKPNRIYLNLGTNGGVENFKTLSEVSWCIEDRVNDDDLEFISVSSILAEIDKLKDFANSTDNFELAEFAIKQLENLIK